MSKLKVVQNKAAQIILNEPFHSSATDVLNSLVWLNLEQRRRLHRCIYVYKCMNGIASHSMQFLKNSEVHSYNKRSKGNLRLPRVTRNWGMQRINYHAIKAWNNLNMETRKSDSILTLKRKVLNSF